MATREELDPLEYHLKYLLLFKLVLLSLKLAFYAEFIIYCLDIWKAIHFNLAKYCIENFTLHEVGNCF